MDYVNKDYTQTDGNISTTQPRFEENVLLLVFFCAGSGLSSKAKMELSCPFGISRLVPQDQSFIPYKKSFTDQACSVKMAGYRPRSFCACLWTSTWSWFINTQKKNLANIH